VSCISSAGLKPVKYGNAPCLMCHLSVYLLKILTRLPMKNSFSLAVLASQ
jgi:hypothetical protein